MDNLINELLVPCKYTDNTDNIIDTISKINDNNNDNDECIIYLLSKLRENNIVYNEIVQRLFISDFLGIFTLPINTDRFTIQRHSDTLNSIEYDENIKSIKLYINNELIYYQQINDMEIKEYALSNEEETTIKAILISFNDIPLISCCFHEVEMEIEYFKPNLKNSIRIIGGYLHNKKRNILSKTNYDLDLQNGVFVRFQRGIGTQINIAKNLINEAHKESIRRKKLNKSVQI